MPVAGAIGGSALIGAGASIWSSHKQSQAAKRALDFQKGAYEESRGNLSPFIDTGKGAFSSLARLYGLGPEGEQGVDKGFDAFKNLQAYKFPFEQGMLALTRQGNAGGRALSGAQLRAGAQFGSGLASQYMMGNYVDPLMRMSGIGAGAAGTLAGAGRGFSSDIGGTMMGKGMADASGIMGAGNAAGGGLTGLGLLQYLGKNPSGARGATGSSGGSYSSYSDPWGGGGGSGGWGGIGDSGGGFGG